MTHKGQRDHGVARLSLFLRELFVGVTIVIGLVTLWVTAEKSNETYHLWHVNNRSGLRRNHDPDGRDHLKPEMEVTRLRLLRIFYSRSYSMNEDHRLHAQTILPNPDYVNVPGTGGGIGVVGDLLCVDDLFDQHAVTSASRSPHMHDSDSNDAMSVGSIETAVEGR